MNSSTPTDNASSKTKRGNSFAVSCVKLGSDSYNVYESKFLDLDVKFADVNGTNMFHVKSFVESYNKVNDEQIVDFKYFLRSEGIPEYLQEYSKIDRVIKSHPRSNTAKTAKKTKKSTPPEEGGVSITDLVDENGYWNISNVIVYCYSQIDNTRGYWCCGEVLSRYAQRGNVKFAVMVDKLIASIATFNEEKINEALKCLTLDNEKMNKRIEYFKKGCTKACNYMKEDVGHDYVAYVEWINSKNAVYIGSMDKKKFMKERAKKNDDGTPARMFIYAKDNKFGIQLRDLYRECLRMLIGMNVKFDHNYIVFQDNVNMNGLQWKIRNCLQRVRAEATTPVL